MFPRLTKDPWGRQVLLTEERWEHILDGHPELEQHDRAVLEVVPRPDLITPDRIDGRWRYWGAGAGVSNWLFVVVDWHAATPMIVTAFGKRKGPRWQ